MDAWCCMLLNHGVICAATNHDRWTRRAASSNRPAQIESDVLFSGLDPTILTTDPIKILCGPRFLECDVTFALSTRALDWHLSRACITHRLRPRQRRGNFGVYAGAWGYMLCNGDCHTLGCRACEARPKFHIFISCEDCEAQLCVLFDTYKLLLLASFSWTVHILMLTPL